MNLNLKIKNKMNGSNPDHRASGSSLGLRAGSL